MSRRFVPDPEKAAANRSDAMTRLEEGVANIQTSDDFQRFLKAQAMFHDYSFGNVLLIISQRPDATQVAGYRQWQKVGRQVVKGAKGIRIIVPMARKVENADGEESTRMGFGTGTVFDVSDTEGESITAPKSKVREGDDMRDLMPLVVEAIMRNNLRPRFDRELRPKDGARGFYKRSEQYVWVDPDVPVNEQVAVLIHELAHALDPDLDHAAYRVDDEHRGSCETVAEGVAYVVAQHFGYDIGESAFTYVAVWAKEPKVMKQALGSIQKIAARIIADMTPAEREAAA